MIIDLFLVALLSLVCLVLTDSSSLVTRLTEECHRSDGERSLEWQTPAVAYPFGSLHDLCVAVVVVLLDEVVRHFRQDFSILLIICHELQYWIVVQIGAQRICLGEETLLSARGRKLCPHAGQAMCVQGIPYLGLHAFTFNLLDELGTRRYENVLK